MEQEINKLVEKFKPLITNIILEDRKYFSFTNIPNWCFFADEDISKVAIFLEKEKLIRINLCSCEYAYSTNNFHMIEYFFLHEIRHYFQYQMVEDYQAGKETIVKKQHIENWQKDYNSYILPNNQDGSTNDEYFFQSIEIDAFVYSYATMKYKYKNVDDLYVPKQYNQFFYDMVDKVVNIFDKQGL